MIYFADPYLDEVLFSAWVRSAEHLQYANKYAYFAEIAGRRTTHLKPHIMPIIDFPCHLSSFVNALPKPSLYTIDALIQGHTFYPYYRPFLPAKRAQTLYEMMCGVSGKGIYLCTNLMNSPIPRRGWFRYCPDCVRDDRATYGECYWHRLHQIYGVLVCPKHHLMLNCCTPEEEDLATRMFMPADRVLSQKNRERVFIPPEMEMAEHIAMQIAFLLDHPQLKLDMDLHHRYRLLLEQRHFLKSSGGVIWIKKAIREFEAIFPISLLQELQCAFDPQRPAYMTWLGHLLGKRTMCQHPLLHVLTIIFFQKSIKEFSYPLEPRPGPFGTGPWPCLNPVCPHYLELSITTCQVYHEGKAYPCTGHFTCSCGFKYSRILKREMDPFRKDYTLCFGDIWIQKLHSLWANSQLSLWSIAKRLGVSEVMLERQIALLGLPPRVKQISSALHRQQQLRIEEARQIWLSALAEDLSIPRMQLRKKYQNVIYLLQRYDCEWFKAHPLPSVPRSQVLNSTQHRRWASEKTIDWNERDIALAEEIRYLNMKVKNAPGKPQRITIARLAMTIPELGWLKRRSPDQYPRSRSILVEVLETQENFVLRKILWLTHKCEEEHAWPGRQSFLLQSGAHRLLHVPSIKEEVN